MNKQELMTKLKALREEQKISINKVATAVGTSHARVKAVEAGESEFLIDLLIKYAAAVGYQLELVPVPAPAVKATSVSLEPVQKVSNGAAKKRIVIEEDN